ncbi:SpaH/EbpB family LPXTG-anchored major pilin [Holdemanella porci]|uniref:SpaH/EbpB family LPXTG-anchored major pilin n=1 Tax=Holdemanella porci TaxID=2652276 RepID=UPI0022E214C0|nr:SpaH/EbpB family LPXTG-anchored major pilin [Holdemanella porci]
MKLIKKIAAIMFAFMMVVSMSCNVKAVEGTSPATEETGTIKINNAIPEQTYTIYKILDLESYSPKEENGKETGNFAYKPSSEWESFIKGENVRDKYFIFDGEYVSWKENADPAAFAKLALDYAKQNSSIIKTFKVEKAPAASAEQATTTVTFSVLDLGYYLVDSSVGTLCSLDTTKPTVEIKEKNGVPSVDKKVSNSKTGTFDTSSTASIGDTVYFKTTITAQPGAQNYVLHDKMDAGLTFNESSVKAILNKNETKKDTELTATYYSVVTSNLEDTDPKCTFHIEFTPKLCESLKANDTITVTYSATLNENAVIAGEGNKNATWLKYGENNNLETTHPTTDTKTFEMHVFKFYKDKKNSDKETGLADAVFTLSKKSDGTEPIKLTKTNENSNIYKVNNNGMITDITTPGDGKFTIQGLGAGTYYLTETKQPSGYNKLSGPVTVVIDENGKVMVKKGANLEDATEVKVENKTGTVLPSTGGTGTTMIYLIGGALVLGSGVVLATKRRVKNK